MKRRIKWNWFIGFICMMLVCFLPTEVAKAEVKYVYEFNEEEQAYYIKNVWSAEKGEEIELPITYNGYPVVGLKDHAVSYDERIKKIIIPDGYTSIGEYAFIQCDNLEEVVIYGKIKTIKAHTFRECPKLITVVLPDTVQKIEEYAFYNSGIQTLTLPKSLKTIEDFAFRDCSKLYQIVAKGDKITIGKKAFYDVSKEKLTFVANKDSDAYAFGLENGFLVSESTKFKVELKGKKMFVGEKKRLTTYNNPYAIKLSSSKKSVVSVSKDGIITAKKPGTATITAKINGKQYKYKITVVERTEQNVLDIIYSTYVTEDMSDYEKAVAANKWICQNVVYDKGYFNNTILASSYTAKGAFEKGIAVCDGYAKAYLQIMQHYNIPTYRVVGSADNGSGKGYQGHAWNLVQIGTNWYNVDTTWNDPIGGSWDYVRDDYLLISDSKLDDDHKWQREYYPKASGKELDKNITTINENGVKISTSKPVVYVGGNTTIKVTGAATAVKWTSADKKIATVSSKGKITGKKAGTTKIYVSTNGKKYAVKVVVKNPTLNASKLTMVKGGSKFTLELTGAKAKKYTSSKSSVVSVNKKGVLTAKKAGTATISVKASNGKTYKCKVTVKEYSLNKTKQTIVLGETYQLSLKGVSKTTQVRWKSSNWKVASVDTKGLVTANTKGTATISATVNGATYKCKITVHEHTLVWKTESNKNKAKAKLTCTSCKKVLQEGVQLVDADGNKYYGKWNTETTNESVLKDFNKKLKKAGYEPMVSDSSFETELLVFMCDIMKEKQTEIAESGYSCQNVNHFLAIHPERTNVEWRWEVIYESIELCASQRTEDEIHRFYMVSFIWDVYGDGSTFREVYAIKSTRDE